MYRIFKEEQPFLVSRDSMSVWRWSDFLCKGFDEKSVVLHKDFARTFYKGFTSMLRDGGIGVRLGSDFRASEVIWWKATAAGFVTIMGSIKADEGSFFGGYKEEGLKVRVVLSFYFRIGNP
ncbi:hypothetical protein V6N12_050961 [Hibiscus sabdariffa]|uniref:Uncharacterized protein n=1 Tax=Hibiscus sabdariffa TaxID=183260 RepID=A0ABR2GE16_9ROSI